MFHEKYALSMGNTYFHGKYIFPMENTYLSWKRRICHKICVFLENTYFPNSDLAIGF